jgi:hypothetical protein
MLFLNKRDRIMKSFLFFHLEPGSPRDLRAKNSSSTALNVTWNAPLRSNGILKNYTIYYQLTQYSNNTVATNTTWEFKQTRDRKITLSNLSKLKMTSPLLYYSYIFDFLYFNSHPCIKKILKCTCTIPY